MAVSPTLLKELMNLDDKDRLEVAQLLLSTVDDGDDLDDEERALLHAALDRGMEDIKSGRVRDAADVIAELQARRRP